MAAALAPPVFAGGEAGELTLRDAGARFVGYTTETLDNGTVLGRSRRRPPRSRPLAIELRLRQRPGRRRGTLLPRPGCRPHDLGAARRDRPGILLAHSAGGGSTFRVPEMNPEKVAGILAFEAAGANPVERGRGNVAPTIVGWATEPPLTSDFRAVNRDGCNMQGDNPSRLVNYADLSIVLLGAEMGLASEAQLKCQAAVWNQAGADASYVWFPDRGLRGGGHFAMAQLDSAEYAEVFIGLAAEIDAKR